MQLLLHWLINAGALLLLPYVFTSITVKDFWAALIVAAVLGLVNAVIRPILVILTLPVTILTLGLFIFVINGLLFWFVASFVGGVHVDGFWAAFWGALAYSIITWVVNSIVFPAKGA